MTREEMAKFLDDTQEAFANQKHFGLAAAYKEIAAYLRNSIPTPEVFAELSDETSVGSALRKRREQLGYSQTLVSESLGISQSHLSLIEAGKRNTPLAQIMRICAFLKLNATLTFTALGTDRSVTE